MEAKDIKSVDDVSNYIEGCLNDFAEGISDHSETSKYLHELTVRVIDLANASKTTPIQAESVSDEEIEKEVAERYPSVCLDWDAGGAFDKRQGFRDCYKWMRDRQRSEGWISVEDRLPKDEKPVLGINAKGYKFIVEFYKANVMRECFDEDCEHPDHISSEEEYCRSTKEGFYEECEQVQNEYDYIVFMRNITHWQPLPKPPLTST